jgi:hypothetical protein
MFSVDLMITITQQKKLISHDTRIFDEYYSQLFKLVAFMPEQMTP